MCLSQITFAPLPIPFRRPFKHAAAVRMCAENVMVMVKDTDGRVGFGEGCPRSYVTGETVASALHFLSRVEGEIRSRVDGPETLERWMDENAHAIDKNPAAFCALELALLDLFARQRNISLEAIVGLGSDTRPLTASAVYGAGGWPAFLAHTAFFSAYGMPDSKLKLTGDPGCDGRRARLLARLGRVRLDANNLWPGWTSAFDGLCGASRYAWAVEEPVQPRDWAGMVRLARAKGLAIVLDESLNLLRDLDAAPAGAEFVLNLRVSKLGGLKRTLRMLSIAKDRGLRVIIGAQVGETSILARAGIAAAAAAGASLAAYEGGYGTWLLKRDAVTPSLNFGHGGRLSLKDAGLESIGTGLRPTAELLSRLG